MPADSQLPLLALTAGDPAGIGPEILAKTLARREALDAARVVAIGPEAVRPDGLEDWDPARTVERAAWLTTDGPTQWDVGRAQAECGAAALAALRAGVELASSGAVDALVTGPVCKRALHLAGEPVEGQTELLARWAGVTEYAMLGVAGELRVMLLTRHLPLRAALDEIRPEALDAHLDLLDRALRDLRIDAPRIALAGLNPHAGESGLLGFEEERLLAPAVERARARGLDVSGPHSPDIVFLDASRGRYDGVLALYHDQAFIPLKLLSADGGVTVITGLPYLRISPVHGTAFDIAGRGVAREENLLRALLHAARWAASGASD